MKITTVKKADRVTLAWLLDNIDVKKAMVRWEYPPSSNVIRFRYEFEMPTLGT